MRIVKGDGLPPKFSELADGVKEFLEDSKRPTITLGLWCGDSVWALSSSPIDNSVFKVVGPYSRRIPLLAAWETLLPNSDPKKVARLLLNRGRMLFKWCEH